MDFSQFLGYEITIYPDDKKSGIGCSSGKSIYCKYNYAYFVSNNSFIYTVLGTTKRCRSHGGPFGMAHRRRDTCWHAITRGLLTYCSTIRWYWIFAPMDEIICRSTRWQLVSGGDQNTNGRIYPDENYFSFQWNSRCVHWHVPGAVRTAPLVMVRFDEHHLWHTCLFCMVHSAHMWVATQCSTITVKSKI